MRGLMAVRPAGTRSRSHPNATIHGPNMAEGGLLSRRGVRPYVCVASAHSARASEPGEVRAKVCGMRYAVWGHETGAARERGSERAEATRRSRVSSGQGAAVRNGSQRGQASNGPTRVAREEQQAGAESDGAWRREVCGRGDGEVVEVISWPAGSQRTDGGASGGRPSINHRPSAMSTISHVNHHPCVLSRTGGRCGRRVASRGALSRVLGELLLGAFNY
jgi:hypothetical protein